MSQVMPMVIYIFDFFLSVVASKLVGFCINMTSFVLLKNSFVDKPVYIFLQQMQVFIELRNVELEPRDLNSEKGHLNEVSETHRLKPHSECERMRPYIFLQIPCVVKSTLLFEVLIVVHITKLKVIVGSAILEERATDIDFANPSVLDDSVGHFCLHHCVKFQFCHQSERVKVFSIRLFKHQSNLIRIIHIVQQSYHTFKELVLELENAKPC